MSLTSHFTVTFDADIDPAHPLTFDTKAWDIQTGRQFNQKEFWTVFAQLHPNPSTPNELIILLADLVRCHFSPKTENWPGYELVIGGGANGVTVKLEKSKTAIKPFKRGKGQVYCYTNACLATAGIFEQLIHSNASGRAACDSIPGNFEGYNQFMGLLDGWTESLQASAETAFSGFITTNNLKKRDPDQDRKIKAAARKTIQDRIAGRVPSAYSMRQVMRLLNGANEGGDPIQKS